MIDRSIRVVLPIALDRRWPEHALKIRRLEQIKDKATAQAAWSLCREAYAAAAAFAAYAAYAAYAADAAYAAYAGEDADARKQIVNESIRTLEIALEIR